MHARRRRGAAQQFSVGSGERGGTYADARRARPLQAKAFEALERDFQEVRELARMGEGLPCRPRATSASTADRGCCDRCHRFFFFFVTGWSPRARQARASPSGAGGAGGWRPPPRAPNRRCVGCQAPWRRWEARDPYELRELGWGMRRASRVRACTLPFRSVGKKKKMRNGCEVSALSNARVCRSCAAWPMPGD